MKRLFYAFAIFFSCYSTYSNKGLLDKESIDFDCPPSEQCIITFEMWDAFNSWNGNTFNVYEDGVLLTTLTGPGNDGESVFQDVAFCDGSELELFWNEGGSSPQHIRIRITDSFGTELFAITENVPNASDEQGTTQFTHTVDCFPACPVPSNFQLDSQSTNDITLSWQENGTANQWDIYFVETGGDAPDDTATPITVNNNPITLSEIDGIEANKSYDFYVRSNCGTVDGTSNWVGPITGFRTVANDSCSDAIELTASPIASLEFTYNGSLNGATGGDTGVPTSCSSANGVSDDDVWFKFDAQVPDQVVEIFNFGGEGLTFFNFAIYEGIDCSNLTEIGCMSSSIAPYRLTFDNLTVGNTYYIRVFNNYSTTNYTYAYFELAIFRTSIDIDESLTVPQLVKDVLMENADCFVISNVTSQNGSDYNNLNSIAKFEERYPTLPFSEGIIMSTGDVYDASGPSLSLGNSGVATGPNAWPGDNQLRNYLNQLYDPNAPIRNASIIEFDFIPLTGGFSFDYMFLSEEYGQYQCSQYLDGFAFFLTDVTAGTAPQNLALVPGTTDPVSVGTVRNEIYNQPIHDCPSANEVYFAQYNSDPPGNNYDGSTMVYTETNTNFRGQTVTLTAQSAVVPGNTYHIKLVIGDRADAGRDSAVFLKAGSFAPTELDLGPDLLVSDNTALCPEESTIISSGLSENDYSFTWYVDNTIIAGENGSDIEVSNSGTYSVEAVYNGTTCTLTGQKIVEHFQEEILGTSSTLNLCSDTNFSEFDLTSNEAAILTGLTASNYTVSYYESLENAETQNDAITNASSFTNTDESSQTIFVAVENLSTGCFSYTQFDIQVNLNPSVTSFTINNPIACIDDTGIFTINGTPNATVTYTENGGNNQTVVLDANGESVITYNNIDEPLTIELIEIIEGSCVTTLSESQTISIESPELISVTAVTTEISYGTEAQFVIIGTPNATVTYTFNDGPEQTVTLDLSGEATVSYPNAKEDVTILVTQIVSTNQCLSSTNQNALVTVVGGGLIPQVFTPNNDGNNDTFDLTGFGVKSIKLYNRFGTEVYSKEDGYVNEWGGQDHNNNALPTGTYYYVIIFSNNESKVSWVYLNR